ncbi:MAG: glutamate--tRNA ligase [Verrucomicrobia bacterium]|nr:glutamate--tRNA ligase [Verrucomicrobiota bacterium]
MSRPVRVRFAPSPTGYLHVGGARTALFNWLFARHTGGAFVLRIEDTDKSREKEAAVQIIYDGLRWLGLEWDEGGDKGGPFGPYHQTERNDVYHRYLKVLEQKGLTYEDAGAVRFRSPRRPVVVEDEICGRIEFDRSQEPDMTIRRPDGSWIFHFANVVDDLEMRISHVIRGEDHLSNTAKHIELYHAFEHEPPRFAHLPLILNQDGSKMSKRDEGASVGSYIAQGYAPEAVRNYLCLLGWSPKDDREMLPIDEVIALFDLGKVNRRNAAFDLNKCLWLNGQYVHQMSLERFCELSRPFLAGANIKTPDKDYLLQVLALVRERVKLFREVPEWVDYFFMDAYPYDPAAVTKVLGKPGALDRLAQLADAFRQTPDWSADALETGLRRVAATAGLKAAEFIHPARVAVSGRTIGPSLYHMLEVLGRDRVLSRLERTIRRFCGAQA